MLWAMACGCSSKKPPEYGYERPLMLGGNVRQTWAVAPVVNLSGQRYVDPILQADIVHKQLQQVAGLNVVPVNQVVAVYASLKIDQIQSEEQAAAICELLNIDALLIATVTAYDPYDPPKLGASLQLFRRGGLASTGNVDPRELARRAAPPATSQQTAPARFAQVIGMFDAANGSTRAEALRYADGRHDPTSPYKSRQYVIEMDRFCGFVYHSLIGELLGKV
jgi:hypothetical protein